MDPWIHGSMDPWILLKPLRPPGILLKPLPALREPISGPKFQKKSQAGKFESLRRGIVMPRLKLSNFESLRRGIG